MPGDEPNSAAHSKLLIVGASARAAAMSAIREGLSPVAADLFADVDLQRTCPAERVVNYPEALAGVLASSAADYWIYTGALENHPRLVARMEKIKPLLGNGAAVIRAARDPLQIQCALRSAGIDSPEVAFDTARLPRDGSWLRKPRRSAGGTGIEPLAANSTDAPSRDFYVQQHIDGQPCSAVFVSADGGAALLGVTEQLIGTSWTGAHGFRYCGSIGPLQLSPALQTAWQRIGDCLADQFKLTGLWGVDAIQTGALVYPVEINPRYTASVEVLERAFEIPALIYHVQACTSGELPDRPNLQASTCLGKAIVYAPCTVRVEGNLLDWLNAMDAFQQTKISPDLADIPKTGSLISAGWPIATVFAEATNRGDCELLLRNRASELFAVAQTFLKSNASGLAQRGALGGLKFWRPQP